jgi:hypothetical protein
MDMDDFFFDSDGILYAYNWCPGCGGANILNTHFATVHPATCAVVNLFGPVDILDGPLSEGKAWLADGSLVGVASQHYLTQPDARSLLRFSPITGQPIAVLGDIPGEYSLRDIALRFRDCNLNAISDEFDILRGTSPDCNANGMPDECDPNCDGQFGPDACCAAGDAECNDCDVCTRGQCGAGACTYTQNIFGDVNHDGLVDIFDILCVLDGFAGVFTTCTMLDVELVPCPDGDGLIDVFDILAVLDAFTGVNVCGCPTGP